jgi:nitrite reductase/ring-hydroxylating ferredoxin subunit
MNRLEFLKTVGFRGPALMALLTSCVNQEDTVIEALSLQNQTESPTAEITPDPSGTTTADPVKLNSPAAISTEALNSIKNPRLKIDLTQTANAALLKVGGYLRSGGIVVAQSAAGVLVAATQTCTHEPKNQVIFNKTEFYCTAHGARFGLTGSPLNTITRTGLTVYRVATDGNIVVVY